MVIRGLNTDDVSCQNLLEDTGDRTETVSQFGFYYFWTFSKILQKHPKAV